MAVAENLGWAPHACEQVQNDDLPQVARDYAEAHSFGLFEWTRGRCGGSAFHYAMCTKHVACPYALRFSLPWPEIFDSGMWARIAGELFHGH